MVPVGSMEGPSRVLDHIRITSSVPRVPWYGLWSSGDDCCTIGQISYCGPFGLPLALWGLKVLWSRKLKIFWCHCNWHFILVLEVPPCLWIFSNYFFFFDAFPQSWVTMKMLGIEKLYSVAIDLNSIVKLKT